MGTGKKRTISGVGRGRLAATLAILATSGGVGRVAQAAQTIPSTAEPGRAEERLTAPPEPVLRRRPLIPPVELKTETAPANAESIRFTIRTLAVDGVTVFSLQGFLFDYAGLVGKEVSLAQLYSIAEELTKRYRAAGYLLSSVVVPAQQIVNGQVRLRAVEGYLGTVNIEGDAADRTGLMQSIRERLMADRPLRYSTLERYLLLLNDLPGVTAQAVLQPSVNSEGAADLLIRTASRHVNVEVGANNRVSRIIGRAEYDASVDATSLLHLREESTLRYVQSNQSKALQLVSLSHKERLSAEGLDLSISATHSRSTPNLAAAYPTLYPVTSNLETATDQASAQLDYPLLRSRDVNLRTRLALTYHNGKTDTNFNLPSQDKIAALRIGVSFDRVDSWNGVNLLDLEVDQGISGLGSSKLGDPLASRVGGNPQFTKATLYLSRLQSLGANWSLLFALSGQDALNNLLAPEEFSFGGESYGRGYDPSEIVGDSGVAAKLELRYTRDRPGGLGYTAYGFFDSGHVWRRLDVSEAGAPKTDSASSAGAGVRLTLGNYGSAYLEVAKPINHLVAAEGNERTRVFGGFRYMFGR